MVKKNPLIRGVTLSGGEPFSQAAEHAELAKLLHENGYEVAAYSGYTFEQLLNGTPEQMKLLENIDILVDGPFLMGTENAGSTFSRKQKPENYQRSAEPERTPGGAGNSRALGRRKQIMKKIQGWMQKPSCLAIRERRKTDD